MVGTLLEATVKTFLDDRFKLEPVAATIMGNHSHDHRLGDLTADGFAARNEFTEDWLRRFIGMGEASMRCSRSNAGGVSRRCTPTSSRAARITSCCADTAVRRTGSRCSPSAWP